MKRIIDMTVPSGNPFIYNCPHCGKLKTGCKDWQKYEKEFLLKEENGEPK